MHRILKSLSDVGDLPGLFIFESQDSWKIFQNPIGQIWCDKEGTHQIFRGSKAHSKNSLFTLVEDLLSDKQFILGGYFGYELLHDLETVPTAPGAPTIPSGFLYIYEKTSTHELRKLPSPNSANSVKIKNQKIALEDRLAPYLTESKSSYLGKIIQIQELIRRGELYQLNLTQRFSTPFFDSPFSLFSRLAEETQDTHYSYLSAATNSPFQVISASPERFFRLLNRSVICSPIKGTIARGRTLQADEDNKKILQSSDKDRAELAMIVDVIRNDLGRIAQTGTVSVSTHAALHSFPTLHHLITDVCAEMGNSITPVGVIKSLFPSASITGAPKIAAMKWILQFEESPREVYTGSMGWLDSGSAEFNVAIRTGVLKDHKFSFSTGGGITIASVPEFEYQETLVKALSLISALESLQQLSA